MIFFKFLGFMLRKLELDYSFFVMQMERNSPVKASLAMFLFLLIVIALCDNDVSFNRELGLYLQG